MGDSNNQNEGLENNTRTISKKRTGSSSSGGDESPRSPKRVKLEDVDNNSQAGTQRQGLTGPGVPPWFIPPADNSPLTPSYVTGLGFGGPNIRNTSLAPFGSNTTPTGIGSNNNMPERVESSPVNSYSVPSH